MQIPHREWAPFPQIGDSHAEEEHRLSSRFGGKGANLHRLHRAGLPVPAGFIVPVEVFRTALASGLEAQLEALAESLDAADPVTPAELRCRCPELDPILEQLEQ